MKRKVVIDGNFFIGIAFVALKIRNVIGEIEVVYTFFYKQIHSTNTHCYGAKKRELVIKK